MNTVSVLWDACLPQDFEQTSFVKVPLRGGVYFNNIYAHAGDTVSCTTSFMTGYDVFGHGISNLYSLLMDGGNSPYPKSRAFPTLPMLLQMNKVHTFLVGEDPLWLSLGYDWIANFSEVETGDLKKLKSGFIRELDEPFFLHLHLWSAHLRGKLDEFKVETLKDKTKSVAILDGHLRIFLTQLLELFPNTQVLIWADHGDTINKTGVLRHAGHLHEDVQHVWAMLIDSRRKHLIMDVRLHAQADLFRLVSDTYDIADNKDIPRYAENPLKNERRKVWAAHWMRDIVKCYPDGLTARVDKMLEEDKDFQKHIRLYGHLMPINHPPPGSEKWPSDKIKARLKKLGYID